MGQSIYIKPQRRVTRVSEAKVKLKDVAEISIDKTYRQKLENLCVFEVKDTKKERSYILSVIDLISCIKENFPELTVVNVGEKDTILHYLPHQDEPSKWVEILKVIMICAVIFAGVSIAIMAYHTDTSLGKTFMTLNTVFTGEYNKNPLYITIPYALGIPVGTLVFFNHIGPKKLSQDPTPIEVEINSYETQVEDAIVEELTNQKAEGQKAENQKNEEKQ